MCSKSIAFPQYRPQKKTLRHTLNLWILLNRTTIFFCARTKEQLGWEWKERTKYHGKKGRRGQAINLVEYLLQLKEENCLLRYCERTGRLSCPSSTPATMGSYKWDAFLPGKWSIASTYGPLHLTLFCNSFWAVCIGIKHQFFPTWEKWFLNDVT